MTGKIPAMVAASAGRRSQAALRATPSARHEPTIIEMFGLPGVGKTTLATAVIGKSPLLTRRNLTAAWNRLPLRQRSAFLLRALADARCIGCAARFAFRSRLTNSDSLTRLLRLVAKTSWMKSHRGEMLLDQSFLQEIWSICISAGRSDPDPAALTQFIRIFIKFNSNSTKNKLKFSIVFIQKKIEFYSYFARLNTCLYW